MPDALIYVPSSPRHEAGWRAECLGRCQTEGWPVAAVVSSWDDVVRLLQAQPEVLIVVARDWHIPPDRLPRIVVAGKGRRGISRT